MKGVVISDTHDNLANLRILFKKIRNRKIEFLLHCGDVCTRETLLFIRENFKGPIFLSLGNGDWELERDGLKSQDMHIFKEKGVFELEGVKIGITHFPEIASRLEADIVFHGHTHYPEKKVVERKIIANPGNMAGLRYAPTFAFLTLPQKLLELVLLHHIEK